MVTWEQFQESFKSSWLINYFSPKLLAELNGLMTHAEPFLPLWFPELSEQDKETFLALKERHTELGWLLQTLAMHSHRRSNLPYPKRPLCGSLGDKFDLEEVPDSIKSAMGYREVLESSVEYGGQALTEFRALRDKAIKPSR
ncbi:hypothetical protein ACVWWO_006409 [Bradyrhizobium sp. F1.13.1]